MDLQLRLSRTQDELNQWSKAIEKKPPIHWEANDCIESATNPECLIITRDNPKEVIRAWWGITETVFGQQRTTHTFDSRNINPIIEESKKNKCLIITNGFYLTNTTDEKFLFEKPSKKIFMLGGIYNDSKTQYGEINRQFAIEVLPAKGNTQKHFNRNTQVPISFFDLKQWEDFLENGVTSSDIDFTMTKV